MGTKERKRKVAEIRREDIIDAAERVFFNKGFTSATMDDIAHEAEYTKRTIYAYFKSKEELTEAILLRAFRTLNAVTAKRLASIDLHNGLDKVIGQGKAYIEFCLNYPDYFKAMEICQTIKNAHETNNSSDLAENECFREGEVGIELLTASVQEGIDDGSIRKDLDPEVMAFVLWAHITGICSLVLNKAGYLNNHYQKTIPQLLEEAIDFMALALKPNKTEA
jgi:AcrR family transcriptional regulator